MRTMEELKKGVAELYDESSWVIEGIRGDHLHHGIYIDQSQQEEASASASLPRAAQILMIQAAQIRTIDEALCFAAISDDPSSRPKHIVDVGCGVGGSSRYLAKKYGATCQGITLSPIQAQRAQALAATEGLADKVNVKDVVFFQVADAIEQPFPDGQFDLVWSLECAEHIHDKKKFVSELTRVAAPGATIIIVTWCHRDLSRSEESLKPEEKTLLKKICDAYYLETCSAADYVQLLQSLSLQDIKTADWSEYATPFWPAVIRTLLNWRGVISVVRAGWKAIKGALAIPLMIEGHKQ